MYDPSKKKVGEPSPQSDPELFTDDEIQAEIKYLMATNRRYGSNPLRTSAYLQLMKVLQDRKADR